MRAERGFTLVEVLVALAVFALVALTAIRLTGLSLASTDQLDRRAVGGIVARNVAIEALIDPALARGTAQGRDTNASRKWLWTRRVGPAPDPALVAIAVEVTDDAGRPAGALTLYRRAP